MKDIVTKREGDHTVYFVDGKRVSVTTARRAEMHNHRALLDILIRSYEFSTSAKSVPLKNTGADPRANNGVFVVAITAEFAWNYAPGTRKQNTDEFSVQRGYKTLAEAVNASKHIIAHAGTSFYILGHRIKGAVVTKDGKCHWQVWYRGASGKEIVLTPLTPET